MGQPLDAALPWTIDSIPLRTSGGHPTSLAALRGKVVVLSDMMTLCQETCPIDTATVVAVARAVARAGLASHVEFLSVTVDPGRDDRRHLAAYRRLFAPPPSDWLVATASSASLALLWRYLGVYTQRVPDGPGAPKDWLTGRPLTYDVEHSDEVFFFDASGRERFLLEGAPHLAPGAVLPGTLNRFMDRQGHDNVTNPDPLAWTETQATGVLSWLTGREIAP